MFGAGPINVRKWLICIPTISNPLDPHGSLRLSEKQDLLRGEHMQHPCSKREDVFFLGLLLHKSDWSHTHTHMQIQTQSGDTHIRHQRHFFPFYLYSLWLVYQALNHTNPIIRTFFKLSMSVSTVAENILTFSSFVPYSFTPPPLSVWIQPNIARDTLPLHHHSRKSTVTEYPEAPGWWLSAWPCLTQSSSAGSKQCFKGDAGNVSVAEWLQQREGVTLIFPPLWETNDLPRLLKKSNVWGREL